VAKKYRITEDQKLEEVKNREKFEWDLVTYEYCQKTNVPVYLNHVEIKEPF